MLFLPIFNGECDNLAIPATDFTVDQLRAMCRSNIDAITSLGASVDGHAVAGLNVPSGGHYTGGYRVVSPVPFSYTLPNDNIYEFLGNPFGPESVSPVVADGVYLMLAPLSPGVHVLHWTGAVAPFDFSQDITYQVTVSPS
jgi:hypothetical protein